MAGDICLDHRLFGVLKVGDNLLAMAHDPQPCVGLSPPSSSACIPHVKVYTTTTRAFRKREGNKVRFLSTASLPDRTVQMMEEMARLISTNFLTIVYD